MTVASMLRKTKSAPDPKSSPLVVTFPTEQIDWDRLVTLDFETYYDQDYTLSKLSMSEYIRDPRFKVQMVGIKIGRKATKYYTGARIAIALNAIPWKTHSLLCHHTHFDGFILSHHYRIQPKRRYCTLSMARGLHSNEIGGGLDEVSRFYGGQGKLEGLDATKGVRDWSPALIKSTGQYCVNDVDECFRIFVLMVPKMPADEMELIDLTIQMFTDPVLEVDLPRVEAELQRELAHRREMLLSVAKLVPTSITLTGADKLLQGEERDIRRAKKAVGSNEAFASMLRACGVTPPMKISPAWMKKPVSERDAADKYSYAFAKDDIAFTTLPEFPELWTSDLNLKKKQSALQVATRAAVIQQLILTRLAVKSTTNITRAERFLTAGANGMPLPCGYAYFRAHTGRWGGTNKMNMQNLKRGGELRKSIKAKKGYSLCVADSGQIEARVNGWLWGQQDLLDAFSDADHGTGRDAYCLMGDVIYGRTITKDDKTERFVSKVCVLGLGFGMGAPKLQLTLAKGALGGPPVHFSLDECFVIVNKYRRKNHRIEWGWKKCNEIIDDMAAGRQGSWKCISWDEGVIYLPNGMTLKYPDLRQRQNDEGRMEWTYQSGGVRKKLYGGLLCENIVQALARIIIGWQMIKIRAKHRVVMTTHDEVVTHVKTAVADKALEFMIKTMRTAPDWCRDLPLNAEGGHDVVYSK